MKVGLYLKLLIIYRMLEVCGVHGAYAYVLSCSHSSHKLAWIHSVNYVHVVDVIRVTSAIDATRSYRILWPCQPEVRNNYTTNYSRC